ncbi:ribulose phosphate epimerase [Enhygromyxa salina]|uniref:ribulose phosphate epimerase n=1 Tax=Enhygromyxa salina TaxID=215803 RepID=UPI0011B28DC3|nr:ribulose phosphate epimerase [Enhygromyxa salina]
MLTLLGVVACGPPGLDNPGVNDDSDGETSTTGVDTTSTTSATSSTTATAEPSTSDDTTSDDTTSDESSDGSLTFVAVSEVGGCECDPFAQDCPEGEKCVAYASLGASWDANLCVPVTGGQSVGEPCSYAGPVEATDDCDATSACWDLEEIDGAWIGVCHSFCDGTPDDPACAQGSECLIANEGSINLCVFSCDPLEQACGDGLGCYWNGVGFACEPSDTHILLGQPCQYVNDCDAGLICLGVANLPTCEGDNCCTSYCDLLLGDGQCEDVPGTSCVPFYEEGEAPIGGDSLGVCIVG